MLKINKSLQWQRRVAGALAAGLLASLLAPRSAAQPQPQQYITTVWQTEQGLPQNTVNAMLQDHQGYLWIGTFGGLARFDGERFTDFANSPGFSSARILALHASRSGDLWIGTVDGGLVRMRGGVATKFSDQEGLPSDYVSSIREDADGKIWINTARGIAQFTGTRLEAYPIHRGRAVVTFYLKERDGSMWFRSQDEVVRFGADGSMVTLADPRRSASLIGEARDGSVWIGFPGEYRIVRYFQREFSEMQLPTLPRGIVTGEIPLLAMAKDTDEDLVLLTPAGLIRVVNGNLSPPEPLPWPESGGVNLRSLLIDREGNRWVGTLGAGLIRFRPTPLRSYGKQEGLSDQSFRVVFQDRQGRLWLGGDLLYWADERGFHLVPGVINIRTMTQTRNGDLWIGGYGGLHRWRLGTVKPVDADVGIVGAIHQDRQGTIWIGSITETRPGGLFSFRDGKWEQTPGITDVRAIIEDRDGGVWLSGLQGLFHLRAGKLTRYGQEQGLSSVSNLYRDSEGTLWIATYGAGLVRFRDGQFQALTSKAGLPNNMLVTILEDDAGHLWLGSNQNIFRFAIKELNDFLDGKSDSVLPVSYGISEGMRSSECNSGNPAAWRAPDGRLWFATLRGVVAINPAAIDPLPPPVVLEEAWAGNLALAHDTQTSIPPGNNTFDFRFTALSFSAPEKLRFKYRLEPYDKDWVDAAAHRTVHYTNMHPGPYSFRVIAANSYGVWNEQGARIDFVLRPHFYQTLSFYLILAAGTVLIAGGAHRLRVRHLQARQVQLQQLVDSRTAELRAEIKVREGVEDELRKAQAELEDRVRHRTAELRASDTRFRAFVDHVTDAFYVIEFAGGAILDVNRQACESLGYTREELVGKPFFEFDVDLNLEWMNQNVRPQLEAGKNVTFETHHRRKDGSVFPVEVRSRSYRHGGRLVVLSLALDITDRKRAEAEHERLRQLEAELAHINRVSMMGEMTASIAHEINQPLSGVLSNGSACLRWLAGESPNLQEAREAAQRIVRDGKRAGEIIARVRALVRKAATPKAQLDLNKTVREVLALVAEEAKKKKVTIQTEFAEDLAPVLGDRVQLQQVVLNIVMNAMDAMNDSTCKVMLITTSNNNADQVRLAVRDTGTGLGPNALERIFDPFYSTKPSGMGMGLSISRSIIQNHGGKLWAVPNDGDGATVGFTIPLYREGEPGARA
jgi:PAS domain S-box-containing protein